jgi:NADH-quinone oxidoreductase subunit L
MHGGDITRLAILIPVLPLLGWIYLGLLGNRLSKRHAGTVATSMVAGSFVVGVLIASSLAGLKLPLHVLYGKWISTGGFEIPFGLQIDQLSMVMVLVVSGVGALIHLYSTGYMADDPGYRRYFAYLNLFTATMLVLVLADNFLLMFVGWEGVGLCSYLLIGFWFEKTEAILAAKKAFIVNRVGDAAFVIGLLLLVTSPLALENGVTRTLTFDVIFNNILTHAGDPAYLTPLLPLITIVAILLFIGATGKSAQIPLYVWLPDAMEGPTPVSALIHAATMVTAGVYMMARANVIFLFAPNAMVVVTIIAALTAFFAATIALAQTDIKRVLAYSTISQIGYMFIGAGVGAYAAAIFHLVTHAFFKACLFLGAGSVIHGTNQQDMRHLGGLKKFMPSTRMPFLIAAATLGGFPLLSAFFSKDTILHEAFNMHFVYGWNVFAGVLGFITALLTAFYSYRLYYRTFEGEYKGPADSHPHDPGKAMTTPVWILAGLSAIAGLLMVPGKINIMDHLAPVFESGQNAAVAFWSIHEGQSPTWIFMLVSVLVFLGGWWTARNIYLLHPEIAKTLKIKYRRFYHLLWEKYRVDEFYQSFIIKPGYFLFGILWRTFDEEIIDNGIVHGTARATNRLGTTVKPFQNGFLRTYALYIILGLVLLVWLAST